MINHSLKAYAASELVPGFAGDKVQFQWCSYAARSVAAQEAFVRLRKDIGTNGLRDPLITHRGHVLVGQRRLEIAISLDPEYLFEGCVEIEEDVANWTRDDVKRLQVFKEQLYGADAIAAFMG